MHRIMQHDGLDFNIQMKDWFNIPKPVNVIHHVNRMKEKNCIISLDAQKTFGKIQHQFMI